jgi:hypothetical protein
MYAATASAATASIRTTTPAARCAVDGVPPATDSRRMPASLWVLPPLRSTSHRPAGGRRPRVASAQPGTVANTVRSEIWESAGEKTGKNAAGHGNPYLARVLAAKRDTFLGQRYRRIARPAAWKEGHCRRRPLHPGHHLAPALRLRRPTPRAWRRLPRHPHRPCCKIRNHIRQLQALGYRIHPRTRGLTTTPPLTPTGDHRPGFAAASHPAVDFRISGTTPRETFPRDLS